MEYQRTAINKHKTKNKIHSMGNLENFLSNKNCNIVFKKFFPIKKYRKFYKTFYSNLFFVCCELKCGYLIDNISIKGNTVVNIINDLISANIIENHIKVFLVYGDIVIVNVPLLQAHLKRKHIFIDVSSDLNAPVILPNNHARIVEIKSVLNDVLEKYSHHTRDLNYSEETEPITLNTGNLCVPTLVGLLLNFPLVYWFKEDYKLTSVHLSVYKILLTSNDPTLLQEGNQSNSKAFELYSFSSPVEFKHDIYVRSFVDELKRSLINKRGDVTIELVQSEEEAMNVVL